MSKAKKGFYNLSLPPQDFTGCQYFYLGHGLGDVVNNLRAVIESQNKFPYSKKIVYLDEKWVEIALKIEGVEVRFISDMGDIRKPKKKTRDTSFEQLFQISWQKRDLP